MAGALEETVKLDRALAIQGWMSKVEMFCLAYFARQSETILEIGCYKGRSARCLADNTSGKVYCVDPWTADYLDNDGKKHKGISPEDNTVYVCQGILADYFNKLPRIDFAFIDGDHRYAEVLKDIKHCQIIVKHEGIIAGHDYGHRDWPGVKEAVDFIFSSQKVNINESIWWVTNA